MKTFTVHSVRNLLAFVIALGLGYTAYVVNPTSVETPKAEAASVNLTGWAWSLGTQVVSESADPTSGPYSTIVGNSSGLGWISVNSLNCDQDKNLKIDTACGSDNASVNVIDYAVNLSTDNKGKPSGVDFFSGRAWGENVGWISFEQTETTYCVGTYGGTRAQIAWEPSGKVTGWARAMSFDASWDGCIKLSDDTNPFWNGKGVKFSEGKFSGYAWGSDVLGWIDFGPKVNGRFFGMEINGGSNTCIASDVDLNTLGNCAPKETCSAAGGEVLPGFQMGFCPLGGSAPVYEDTSGNPICYYKCPTASAPSTGKTKFWQF